MCTVLHAACGGWGVGLCSRRSRVCYGNSFMLCFASLLLLLFYGCYLVFSVAVERIGCFVDVVLLHRLWFTTVINATVVVFISCCHTLDIFLSWERKCVLKKEECIEEEMNDRESEHECSTESESDRSNRGGSDENESK